MITTLSTGEAGSPEGAAGGGLVEVAVKVQRPHVLETVSCDLFILRRVTAALRGTPLGATLAVGKRRGRMDLSFFTNRLDVSLFFFFFLCTVIFTKSSSFTRP